MKEITSMQNLQIKQVVKLRKRNKRDESNLFIIEGYRELLRASCSKYEIQTLFFCEEYFLKNNEQSLIKKLQDRGVEIIQCTKSVFLKISYRDRPDGLLALAKQKYLDIEDLKKVVSTSKNPFFVIAEGIEKPGNLGTILRSCDGVGADGLIVCDPCTDIFNPNVVRASVGTLFSQNIYVLEADVVLSLFKERGIQIVATTPHTDKIYYDADLKEKVAIVVGTEQYGLSEKWLTSSDTRVSIPMAGIADSLNVATATTILLYEVLRQRNL